jgi:hypothetical protein
VYARAHVSKPFAISPVSVERDPPTVAKDLKALTDLRLDVLLKKLAIDRTNCERQRLAQVSEVLKEAESGAMSEEVARNAFHGHPFDKRPNVGAIQHRIARI